MQFQECLNTLIHLGAGFHVKVSRNNAVPGVSEHPHPPRGGCSLFNVHVKVRRNNAEYIMSASK